VFEGSLSQIGFFFEGVLSSVNNGKSNSIGRFVVLTSRLNRRLLRRLGGGGGGDFAPSSMATIEIGLSYTLRIDSILIVIGI
jgi:hypothetical protein